MFLASVHWLLRCARPLVRNLAWSYYTNYIGMLIALLVRGYMRWATNRCCRSRSRKCTAGVFVVYSDVYCMYRVWLKCFNFWERFSPRPNVESLNYVLPLLLSSSLSAFPLFVGLFAIPVLAVTFVLPSVVVQSFCGFRKPNCGWPFSGLVI